MWPNPEENFIFCTVSVIKFTQILLTISLFGYMESWKNIYWFLEKSCITKQVQVFIWHQQIVEFRTFFRWYSKFDFSSRYRSKS